MIITGGYHSKLNLIESHVIIEKLLAAGVPENAIIYEKQSTNSLENVLFARGIFNFEAIDTLLFICKAMP
ncbi:ElyC/SanA/YdcF family protein [Heyndrickxia sporothermodurans]